MRPETVLDLDQLPCGLITVDASSVFTQVNQNLCQFLGRESEQLLGQPLESILSVPSRVYYLGSLLPTLQKFGRAREQSLDLTTAGGERLPVLVNAVRLQDVPQPCFQLAVMPMQRRYWVEEKLQNARKQAEEAVADKERALRELELTRDELQARERQLTELNQTLERLATRDPLTGLANRRVYDREFDAQLARLERTGRPFSLVLADIDHFKQVNDTFGHEVGDQVLARVAQLLKGEFREVDILVRMGGEEFAVILPESKIEGAYTTAERARQVIERADWAYGNITMSFGVATAQPGEHKAELYGRADQALYRAKGLGRNRTSD